MFCSNGQLYVATDWEEVEAAALLELVVYLFVERGEETCTYHSESKK